MSENLFMAPKGPAGLWDQLSENEKAWIEFIRVISAGGDPRPSPAHVRALREILDAGCGVGGEMVSRSPS